MDDTVLRGRGLTIRFGGLVALDQVDIDVRKGEIVAVIGPNGAGKSTLFNIVTGVYAPSDGRVWFDGADITGRPTHEIVARGIARTFQASRLFGDLSVLDNVVLGLHTRTRTNVLEALLLPSKSRRELSRKTFSGGSAAICSTSASGPKLLLLDEPTAGMDDRDTDALIEDVRKVRADRSDLSIIVVEHDMRLVAALPERVIVLDYGRKIADATFDEVRRNPRVQEAYLGSAAS